MHRKISKVAAGPDVLKPTPAKYLASLIVFVCLFYVINMLPVHGILPDELIQLEQVPRLRVATKINFITTGQY